jgi:hypothetical protein
MKAQKLVWSWFDGDGVYANTAESLEDIIEEIFEYYFDEELVVAIKKTDHHFEIEVCDGESGSKNLHKIENSNSAVAEFLEFIASEDGRPDEFSIATVG